ncbi:hypothetical protein EVAR_73171_1 [Eumeta japonica]|uniref:Retrotransposon gag domain-containing protein n=1 Tax=Eumeta variegata TaxID=151549 RepID=A0A4C1SMJ7_EUMVA|nr:hypothetical protein EVAR_73171_1 [Eumeta japonica]
MCQPHVVIITRIFWLLCKAEHRKDIHRAELRGREQKMNETLQDYVLEIEWLVQLAYPGENHLFMDNFKTETFINGIRDPDIKFALKVESATGDGLINSLKQALRKVMDEKEAQDCVWLLGNSLPYMENQRRSGSQQHGEACIYCRRYCG